MWIPIEILPTKYGKLDRTLRLIQDSFVCLALANTLKKAMQQTGKLCIYINQFMKANLFKKGFPAIGDFANRYFWINSFRGIPLSECTSEHIYFCHKWIQIIQ